MSKQYPPAIKFQSTLPAGEATQGAALSLLANWRFQSTLPAGEATTAASAPVRSRRISIHASRGGSDTTSTAWRTWTRKFQSTLPAGEATRLLYTPFTYTLDFNPRFPRGKRHGKTIYGHQTAGISIHASRGGSDNIKISNNNIIKKFQSTLPAGEATKS